MSIRNPQTPEELAQRRAHWRDSKRRARAAQHRHIGPTCRVKVGPYGACLGRVIEEVDRLGRVHYVCEGCERRRAGICQRCPRAVYGKRGWALYCAECKRRTIADQNRKWVQNNRARKNASVRAWRKRQRA